MLTSLSPAQARQQVALQDALAGNAPTDVRHASEHARLEAAEARVAGLSPARRRALRLGIQAAAARAEAPDSLARTIQAQAAADAVGPAVAPLAPDNPQMVGAWMQAPFEAPSYAINMVMLPTGKVLVYSMGSRHAYCDPLPCRKGEIGNGGVNANNDGTAAVWDPAKGTGHSAFKILPPPNVSLAGYDLTDVRADPDVIADNDSDDDDATAPAQDEGAEKLRPAPIFCSGQVQMADGRVLIAGGNLETRGRAYGVKMVFLFDPFTERWTREPDMLHARWYPTLTRTASGRIAILGGHDEAGTDVASIELYPEQGTPVPGVGSNAAGTTGHHTTSLYDDADDPSNPLGNDPTGEDNRGPGYYPFTLVLPDGRLSVDSWGSGRLGILGTPGDPNIFNPIPSATETAASGEYATAFPAPGNQFGTGELITAGGLAVDDEGNAGEVQSTVWSIKPAAAQVASGAEDPQDDAAADWTPEAPLNIARRNAVATLLPDGSAVITAGGGTEDRVPLADIQGPQGHAQNRVELWDPVTREWTLGPAEITPRGYHSTAVLLPDGRVLSGGDDWVSYATDQDAGDAYDSTFEIYSPPYLFQADRPVLSKAPARVEYGKAFSVTAGGTGGHHIASASLVAPGAATHAYDSNQRVLRLPVKTGADGNLEVTAPVSGAAAPPGDYMLFMLDERGVPTTAKFLRVGANHAGEADYPVGTTPPATTPTPAATTPKATTPAATTPKATTPAATTPKATTPKPTTPKATTPKPGKPPINLNPSGVVKTPPATPEIKLTGKRLSLLLAMTPTGKKCPVRVNAVAIGAGRKVKAKLKLKPLMADGKLTCILKGSIKLGQKPKVNAKVRVTLSAKGVKRRTVRAVR